jgi:outer membrane biosynthesis protein TonB
MKFGLPISIGLHAFAVGAGLIVFGGKAKPFEDSRIIPIELVTLSENTNISAAIRKPVKEILPEPEPEEPMTLETPMENAEEEAPDFSERTEEPVEKTVEEIIPEKELEPTDIPKEVDPEPETQEPDEPVFDLDKLSGLVNKTRSTAPEKNQQQTLQSEQNTYRFAEAARSSSGEGTDMTLSEMDALQSAMYKCWRMPADAQNPEKLVVSLDVKLLPGGFVDDVRVKDRTKSRMRDPGNPFWDVAEQRALRAVSQCAPYDFLPDEKYANWRSLTLNFAPQL